MAAVSLIALGGFSWAYCINEKSAASLNDKNVLRQERLPQFRNKYEY